MDAMMAGEPDRRVKVRWPDRRRMAAVGAGLLGVSLLVPAAAPVAALAGLVWLAMEGGLVVDGQRPLQSAQFTEWVAFYKREQERDQSESLASKAASGLQERRRR